MKRGGNYLIRSMEAAMGMLTACLTLGCPVASPAYAVPAPAPQEQTAHPNGWTSEVHIYQTDNDPAKPEAFRLSGFSRGTWRSWITPADIPADLRDHPLQTNTFVAVDVDTQGKASNCRVAKASDDARLDQIACRLLVSRGVFDIRYEAPGNPVAVTRIMAIRWETLDAAVRAEQARMLVAPPAPPLPPENNAWPRFSSTDRVAPVSLPAIQTDYPRNAGHQSEGVVSLDLVVSAAAGIRACEIGVSSGNPILDQAACREARRLELRYTRACDSCSDERLPLQVVWRKRGSHIRLPLRSPYDHSDAPILRDPADTRTAITYARPRAVGLTLSPTDFEKLADRAHSRSLVRLDVAIDRDGKATGCTVALSSGNPAIDRHVCELVISRGRFAPLTDIFGEPAAATQWVWVNLKNIF